MNSKLATWTSGGTHVAINPLIADAFAATLRANKSASLSELPMPVRFRASGALAKWQRVMDHVPGANAGRAALQDINLPVGDARIAAGSALTRQIFLSDPAKGAAIHDFFIGPCTDWLAFWWRDGVVYEPTAALGTLLGETDWSGDLPMRYLRPPARTLCIVPPRDQRALCGGMEAILVFSHDVPAEETGTRALTMVAYPGPEQPGDLLCMSVPLTVGDEDELLADILERGDRQTQEAEAARRDGGLSAYDEEMQRTGALRIREVLNYVIKVLLYIEHDGAELQQLKPFTEAPRVFKGLGLRKREAKLAEIDRLYDRWVVGPSVLPAALLGDGDSHEVSVHWRRGHLRLQAHGPQRSLRKVVFIAPVLVRADRLAIVE